MSNDHNGPLQDQSKHGTQEVSHLLMTTRAVVFDLDGTLLDTLVDIAESANKVLMLLGYPAHPVECYREFVGRGVPILFRQALPDDARRDEIIQRCVPEFHRIYGESADTKTTVYAGIPQLLDALHARKLKTAILSNKPHDLAIKSVRRHLSAWPFDVVFGDRDGVPRKPAPDGALEIAQRLNISPESFLYLGDTDVDMQTARDAGMHPVGAGWGFRTASELLSAGAAVVLESPLELIDCLSAN